MTKKTNCAAFKKIISLLVFLFPLAQSYSQAPSLSPKATVSILTCGTGNESYSLFGHTAVRITDPAQQIDVVYNYGAFDFDTPNFVAKFSKGDLQYFVIAHSYEDFIIQYHYEKRSVYEQQLAIPAAYKQKLFDRLNAVLHSNERYYTYKFIDKNCTTMVVDLINTTLGSRVLVKKSNTDLTYRAVLYPYFEYHFYDRLGISILFGTKVDERASRLFLPFELLESLEQASFQQHPLAPQKVTLFEFEKEIPTSWWNHVYSYLLLLVFILLIHKKSVDLFFLSLIGFLGLFFLFMGFYSLHPELAYNYNILLFNPALLVWVYFYCNQNQQWMRRLSLFSLFCLLSYLIFIANKVHLFMVFPLIITSGVLLIRLQLRQKKQTPSTN
jgi:hypothetical protein